MRWLPLPFRISWACRSRKVAESLREFTGARAGSSVRFDGDEMVVVDDYAHHPTEIRVTIAAAQTLGYRRILAAFQPHRYSRTQSLCDQFGTAFQGVDRLFLTDVYVGERKADQGVSGRNISSGETTGQVHVIYRNRF